VEMRPRIGRLREEPSRVDVACLFERRLEIGVAEIAVSKGEDDRTEILAQGPVEGHHIRKVRKRASARVEGNRW